MIIIATHAAKIGGKIYDAPASSIREVLNNSGRDFIYIRHSIDGKMPTFVYYHKNKKIIKIKKLFILSKLSILRYISEIITTIFFLMSLKNKSSIYIGVDPLNALSGVISEKLNLVKKTIFYTPDYSPKRFSNNYLNNVYHAIDKYCVFHSYQVWNVSSRMYKIRQRIGLKKNKNIFIPNVPSNEYKLFLRNRKNKQQLITLGIIDRQLDYYNIFDAIGELKNVYPAIILKIIGNGPKENEYKDYVLKNNLQTNVKFLGYLNHHRALEEISRSGIGLALYNGKWGFNYYGDSMKCREYFCFGLPVITTNTHSTVEEIKKYKTGIICKIDKEDYKEAIIKILKNYNEYSSCAYKLAKKYDNIHAKFILKLSNGK